MPSKKRGADLILFSSQDPEPLVRWLTDTFGLQNVLRVLSEHRPGGTATPAKRASKKRSSKKGGKKGRPKGSKNVAKKGGGKGAKGTRKGGGEIGNN